MGLIALWNFKPSLDGCGADVLEEGDSFVMKQLCKLFKRARAPVPMGHPPEKIQAISRACSPARRVSRVSWTWF